jgi:hypothetical protein
MHTATEWENKQGGSTPQTGRGREEIIMPKRKLTPEGEVIAAYSAAMVAAFQVLGVRRSVGAQRGPSKR